MRIPGGWRVHTVEFQPVGRRWSVDLGGPAGQKEEECPGPGHHVRLPAPISDKVSGRCRTKVHAQKSNKNQERNKNHIYGSLFIKDRTKRVTKETRKRKPSTSMESQQARWLEDIRETNK